MSPRPPPPLPPPPCSLFAVSWGADTRQELVWPGAQGATHEYSLAYSLQMFREYSIYFEHISAILSIRV